MTPGSPTLRHRRNKPENEDAGTAEVTPLLENNDDVNAQEAPMKEEATGGYKLEPLIERSAFARLDVGPFLLCYFFLIAFDCMNDKHAYSIVFDFLFPMVLFGQLSLFLTQQWSVQTRARVGYTKTNDVESMTHCLVEAPSVDKHHSANDDGIVVSSEGADGVIIVRFRDVVFRSAPTGITSDLDVTLWGKTETAQTSKHIVKQKQVSKSTTRCFHRLRYPINLPITFYKKWPGYTTLSSLTRAQQVYGPNTTPIDLPPFMALLQEQVVAPFFLFQILCVVLWSLDEYWYYALFTLFALLMFESTVAYNRLQALRRLRSHTMSYQRPIYVYRPGFPPGKSGWVQIMVSELVPGDVVSCRRYTLVKGSNYAASEQQWNRIPADILLLGGDAVVDEALLTGESIPQLKGALSESSKGQLDLQEHKESILFGGSTLLVSNGGTSCNEIPKSPDGGVVGLVLRTGFETAQGSLLRTMAHTQKSVDGIHTRDTYVFIFILLCCAIASAAMVLQEGWSDPDRNRFRLTLHVIIIVTSVVPPELPMELSLAVTNSVTALIHGCQVYCTEVFRIPLAGQVNTCCFDKTGTLTSDEMQLIGVRRLDNEGMFVDLASPDSMLPWKITRIMASCHSLAINAAGNGGREIVGDPLEKAILKDTGYQLIQSNALRAVSPIEGRPSTILILQRYRFSSKLKRMSVLVREDTMNATWVLSKGAPETIKSLLDPSAIPMNYDEVSMQHMAAGQRVLAVAYRELQTEETKSSLKDLKRESVEKGLKFAGFLLLNCPVKPDSRPVIAELLNSGHNCHMITGDALPTAASVALQVGIIRPNKSSGPPLYQLQHSGNTIELTREKNLKSFKFVPLTGTFGAETVAVPDALSMAALVKIKDMTTSGQMALCLSGDTLDKLGRCVVKNELGSDFFSFVRKNEQQILFHPSVQSFLKELVPLISVFARHAPRQKEAIIAAFNAGGNMSLMCGDGTNDVGALRRAHVGISLISAPEVEAKQRKAAAAISKEKQQQKKAKKDGKKRVKTATLEDSLRQLREAQEELESVELGDASIASPFTSRTVSIKCCKDVLQQGRCTLVTMLQIYKILGVNCLVNATVLSKLFLHGVKNGDRQLTVLGLGVAALFFFVTRGKAVRTLSVNQPPSSVLCTQAILSIALQFLSHLGAILLSAEAALAFVDPYDPSMIPDGPFNPNTLNSCTFLVSAIAMVNTFAVNYRGEPFMEPLRKNKMLLRSLQVCYAMLFGCALEVFPPLNDLFQLSEMPVLGEGTVNPDSRGILQVLLYKVVETIGFPIFISSLMIIDTILAFAVERTILRLYEPQSSK